MNEIIEAANILWNIHYVNKTCQICLTKKTCLWRKNNKLNLKPVVLVPVLAPAKIVPAPTPAPAPVPVQDQKKRNDQERIADYRQADQMFNFVNF